MILTAGGRRTRACGGCYIMKILILSCGTGDGHNSAAKAVYDNLKGKNTECEIRDVLSFKSERAARDRKSVV